MIARWPVASVGLNTVSFVRLNRICTMNSPRPYAPDTGDDIAGSPTRCRGVKITPELARSERTIGIHAHRKKARPRCRPIRVVRGSLIARSVNSDEVTAPAPRAAAPRVHERSGRFPPRRRMRLQADPRQWLRIGRRVRARAPVARTAVRRPPGLRRGGLLEAVFPGRLPAPRGRATTTRSGPRG